MKIRRCIPLLLTAVLLASLWPAQGAAASPWSAYQSAQAAEARGDWAGAATLYQVAAEGYAGSNTINAALMYGHAGRSLAQIGRYDEAAAAWYDEARYWNESGGLQERIAAERKADWVRSEVRLFVSTSPEAVADRYYTGAKHEPVTGAYLGVYAEQDGTVHDPSDGEPFYTEGFAQVAGRQHPIFLLYANWSEGHLPDSEHIAKIKAAGGALQWALQPDQGLAAVQDGPYLRRVAKMLKEAGIPVFVRFAGEMNGEWVAWHDDPELYKEKFRLVARVLREEAPNVAMLWAPGHAPLYTMESYYPGDDAVDWVGISAYGIYDPSLDPVAPAGQQQDPRPLHDTFAEVYRLYADRKPIMLAEGGVGFFDYSVYQDRTPWAVINIQRFYAAVPRLYPRVKALVWFDVDLSDSGRDKGIMKQNYRLPGKPQALAAYRQAIADPFYLSGLGDTAGRVYLDPIEMGVAPQKVELSSYVRAYDPFLSRVEYAIGEQILGASNSRDPWAIMVDFAPYAGQTVTLTVRAYGQDGRLVVTRELPVRVGAARVDLHGRPVAFDYQPRMEGESLLVPLRHLATATGMQISANNGRVTLMREGRRVALQAGLRTAEVDGQAVDLPVAPVIEAGRMMVPLRAIEWLGLAIEWDGQSRTASLK